MPPHGPGFTGALHSHDPEYPDDSWNLYSMLDRDTTTALNVTRPDHAIGVFKPHVLRLSDTPIIISDADEEIIVICRFTSPVHVRKLIIVGGGELENYPSYVKCYADQEGIDFTNIASITPIQEFPLVPDVDGTLELRTLLRPFTNISSLVLYFPSNIGGVDNTIIRSILMQGEHTHYRREAVHTEYEVLCNGQDIVQPEEGAGAHSHMH